MKTALVTGAGRGIGRAAALRLGADGFRVAVNYARDSVAAKEVVDAIEAGGGSAFAIQAELGSEGAVESLAQQLEREVDTLDVLVNNAGVSAMIPIEEVTAETYDRVFNVNVRDLFFLTQRLLPLIPDGGRIVNLTSGVARIAFPQGIAYAMTKGAVQVFTLALAQQLGPRGITVNNVAPGIIDTPMNADWLHQPGVPEFAASRHALNRLGTTDEIAAVISFAAGDGSSFITGTTLDATGGGNL